MRAGSPSAKTRSGARRAGGSDCDTYRRRAAVTTAANRCESEESVSSALNQNSKCIAAAGVTAPVYVSEPPLSPPSPRASAQAPAPAPPPERPVLEVAPPPALVAEAPPAAAPPPAPEPEAPADLPLEGLLLRFGLVTTEQLTEAMRERNATGKDIGAIVVERGWVDAAQLARVVSAPEPAPEPQVEPESKPEPAPSAPPPAATQPAGQRVKVFVRLTSGERVDTGAGTGSEAPRRPAPRRAPERQRGRLRPRASSSRGPSCHPRRGPPAAAPAC